MDWSKIKTIFILTFLVLDVYLFYQFMKIHDANKYEFITEASTEDQLKADEIHYVELPKTPIMDQYISAKPKTFTKDDFAKLKGQSAESKNGTTVVSKLDKPAQLSLNYIDEATSFLKDHVLYGSQYKFWGRSDKNNTITFYEQYHNHVFYKNINGMITLNLNKGNQIISYQQTYLEGIDTLAKKTEILPPLKAIETLHQNGILKPKSNVTKVELGYSTLVQLTASQVLAPTWRVVVNDKNNLFVNAFEGQIINFNNEENQ